MVNGGECGEYLREMPRNRLNQHPLTTTLDEFIKHKSHVSQGKATNVEAEEFGCVSCA